MNGPSVPIVRSSSSSSSNLNLLPKPGKGGLPLSMDPSMEQDSMRVTYDDPNQRAAMRRLMELVTPEPTLDPSNMSGAASSGASSSTEDVDGLGDPGRRGLNVGKIESIRTAGNNGSGGLGKGKGGRMAGF